MFILKWGDWWMCTRNELGTILDEIAKSYRAAYGDDLFKILLYGSYARGDFCDDSDIDIAAIVRGSRQDLQDKLKQVWERANDLELEYETLVSPTVIPLDEYERYKKDVPYYSNIEKEGILLNR
ncbi:MAG: nucleotidyltransferase domain-containing protein [Lachnospiraceae bacterium]|nr:nucleotidyltransferase domain-containing protein [Lachnospiraceae bacterium]